MKKGLKITLIAIAALLVLAIAAVALALILQLDLKALNPTRYVTNEYTPEAGFTGIDVDCAECSVRLIPTYDEAPRVVCRETDRIRHSVETRGNTLTIRREDDRRWYERFGLSSSSMVIEIYLPQTDYEQLSVVTKSGDIEVSDCFSFTAAELHASSGDISFSADATDSLKLSASSGDIFAGWSSPLSLEVETSSGDIKLDSVSSEGACRLHSSSGSVTLYSLSCDELSVDTSSGSVECSNVSAYTGMEIETSSGSVRLDYCDTESIRVKTSSGSVDGTMQAHMEYRVSSSSGSINVPPNGSDGVCEIKTSSGSIWIRQEQ